MGIFSRKQASSAEAAQLSRTELGDRIEWRDPKGRLVCLDWIAGNSFQLAVTGLDYHQPEVSAMLAGIGDLDSGSAILTAELVREPRNAYDSNAIRVDIAGGCVGYVPSEDAAVLARSFDALGSTVRVRSTARVQFQAGTGANCRIRLDVPGGTRYIEPLTTPPAVDDRTQGLLSAGVNRGVRLWPSGEGWARTELVSDAASVQGIRAVVAAHSGAKVPTDGTTLAASAVAIDDGTRAVFYVDGYRIGHLGPEEAKYVRPILRRLHEEGMAASAAVNMWTGYSSANAHVDLAGPETILPINAVPQGAHAVIPSGKAVQVTGEEDHLTELVEFLSGASARAAWATLDLTEGRGGKPIVQVSISGREVGRLTPGMSAEFAPVVKLLADQGSIAVVTAWIKGSALKADVTIRAQKAGELSADWIASATS